MGTIVQRGQYKGHQIRKGRKWHKCTFCQKRINAGSHYLELEVDPDLAGGFGMKKICMSCAGDEADAAVSYIAFRRVELDAARTFGLVDEFGRYDLRSLLDARKSSALRLGEESCTCRARCTHAAGGSIADADKASRECAA